MLTIEQIPIAQLKPNPRNPRDNDAAVDAVARSIQEFGFNVPILISPDGTIIAGHTRWKASLKLGLEVVPIIRLSHLDDAHMLAFMVADNQTASLSGWDEDLLSQIVSELNLEADFDLGALGFDDTELSKLLDTSVEDEDDKEDDAPPLPEVPVSKPGDLYILGDHRLFCGDATDPSSYKALLEGEKIDIVITDAPYNVDYHSRGKKGEQWGGIANDNMSQDAFESFLLSSFTNISRACRQGATAYMFHGISMAGVRVAFEKAFIGAGFHLSSTIIWAKTCASMGWQDYREAHECMLYGWIGEGHRKIKDRTQTTVWEISREGNYRHPCQKPVALLSRALRNSSIRGERCLDVFAGSGSTLIACEQLGRRCYCMELDPRYADVIVRRWETYSGRKAELIRLPSAEPKVEAVADV